MMPTFINQNLHLALLFAEFFSIIWIRIFNSGILWMSIGCCIIIMIFEYISIFKHGCCASDLFFFSECWQIAMASGKFGFYYFLVAICLRTICLQCYTRARRYIVVRILQSQSHTLHFCSGVSYKTIFFYVFYIKRRETCILSAFLAFWAKTRIMPMYAAEHKIRNL